jgi:hypothetical protein
MKAFVFVSSLCICDGYKIGFLVLAELFSCEGNVKNGFHGMKSECVSPTSNFEEISHCTESRY